MVGAVDAVGEVVERVGEGESGAVMDRPSQPERAGNSTHFQVGITRSVSVRFVTLRPWPHPMPM